MLFEWRGSVLPVILPRLLLIFGYACLVVWTGGRIGHHHISLSLGPFTLSGIAISIFLGFRNSASYDRFWEGRRLWGALLNVTRSLARQAINHAGLAPSDAKQSEWTSLLIAVPYTLRHQLRRTDPAADLHRLLPPSLAQAILAAKYRPAFILRLLGDWVAARRKEAAMSDILASTFDQNLNELSDVIGGCERLANTPLPYGYSVIIHRTIYLYCALLPFGLLDSTGRMTPVLATFIAYTFIALDTLAEELEEPFGTDFNDLPLDALSTNIEIAIRDFVGQP